MISSLEQAAKNKPIQSVICGRSVHDTRAVKAKLYKCSQKVRAFGSVSLDLIRLFHVVSLVTRLQCERDFFCLTCSVNKEKGEIFRIFVFQATAHNTSTSSSHLGCESRSGRKPQDASSSAVTSLSVQSDPPLF